MTDRIVLSRRISTKTGRISASTRASEFFSPCGASRRTRFCFGFKSPGGSAGRFVARAACRRCRPKLLPAVPHGAGGVSAASARRLRSDARGRRRRAAMAHRLPVLRVAALALSAPRQRRPTSVSRLRHQPFRPSGMQQAWARNRPLPLFAFAQALTSHDHIRLACRISGHRTLSCQPLRKSDAGRR